MDFIIRKATLNDSKIVNDFLTKLIHDEKKYDENINENCVVYKLYENLIENEQNCVLVAETQHKIIGYLYGYVQNNGDAYIDIVTQMDAMYVLENFRKFGVGNALIYEFKKWSKDKGAKYIELKVCNGNEPAIKLYEKNGFENIKTIMSLKLD